MDETGNRIGSTSTGAAAPAIPQSRMDISRTSLGFSGFGFSALGAVTITCGIPPLLKGGVGIGLGLFIVIPGAVAALLGIFFLALFIYKLVHRFK